MGSRLFEKIKNRLNNEKSVISICNLYKGKYEEHFFSNLKETNIYSLSKNITALCIGILFEQKKLFLEEDIYSIFKDDYDEAISYRGVTIRDLLCQVSGIDRGFLDVDVDDISQYAHSDYLKIIFDKGIKYKDKNVFVYSDSNYYLLGRIIEKKSSISLKDFIIKNIFIPLKIEKYNFYLDPCNKAMGATGVYLDSKAITKIASILINDGKYENKQILSKEYIKMMKEDLVEVDEKVSYGYSLWKNNVSNLFYGSGMYGQLFVLYDKEIITILSKDENNSLDWIKKELLEGKYGDL